MPRKPTPKKVKPAKPDFVFPPGGAAIAPVPGLRLKPRTGDVPRWWPVDKPGKAPFACNVPGVTWDKSKKLWKIQHTDDVGNLKTIGSACDLQTACNLRASAEDGHAEKGSITVVDDKLCMSKCGRIGCPRKNISICEFAPDPCKYKKKFVEFGEVLGKFLSGQSSEALRQLHELCRSKCLSCRDIAYASNMHGLHNEVAKCVRVIVEIKAQWAADGGCKMCGTCDVDVLSGDHKDRQGKDDYHQILNPFWWSMNGGAEVLRKHYIGPNTTVQCLCLFCHALQPSHTIYENVDHTEPGTHAKKHHTYKTKKQNYVNKHKISKKTCEHPLCQKPDTGYPREITAANVHAFQCAHVDDVAKEVEIATLAKNTQSPATAIPKLKKEMAECKIYCANCHHKYDTLPRLKEGRELLDALLARGAPVCVECE